MSAEDLTPENLQNPAIEKTDRSEFINKTYGHLLAAIFLFAGIEWWVFQTPYAEQLAVFMLQKSWLAVLGGFIVVSWIATHVAHNVESKGAQYAALLGFVIAEAIIFIPMFFIALAFDPAIIQNAVMVTLGAFVVLSAVAMFSGRDFSFLRSFLMWGGVIAPEVSRAAAVSDRGRDGPHPRAIAGRRTRCLATRPALGVARCGRTEPVSGPVSACMPGRDGSRRS